jgi:hypothetical protein
MARLDRLGPAKEIAQVGATLGREFSYELLHSISPVEETLLQRGLKQLVAAELVYQRGLVPQAHYLFKHALIQDTAYQSVLKSTRQQSHRQIAQVLADRFPETVERQPELVAHHYTEAGLIAPAVPYWQQAGERATQRSAYIEGVAHLTRGLELLKALPETPERVQQEFTLQLALGVALMATKGFTAPDVEKTLTRAPAVPGQQAGETSRVSPAISEESGGIDFQWVGRTGTGVPSCGSAQAHAVEGGSATTRSPAGRLKGRGCLTFRVALIRARGGPACPIFQGLAPAARKW